MTTLTLNLNLMTLTRSNDMSRHDTLAPEVIRGSRRMTSVWLGPPPEHALPTVPASAGRWVEREPNTYARLKVTIPVTVGSTLR